MDFISSCVSKLQTTKEPEKTSPFPKNAIARDFKQGIFTLRYLQTAAKAKHLMYATEMMTSFCELTWEEQTEHREQVLKAIFVFCDAIPLWQRQSLLIVRSFYCTYFKNFYSLMCLSQELFVRHPRVSRYVCQWLLSEVSTDENWAVISILFKNCQGHPEEALVARFLFDCVHPTKQLFGSLFEIPVSNITVLDHFYQSLSTPKQLPKMMQPLFTTIWAKDDLARVLEILKWGFDKMKSLHPCQKACLKLVAMAEQSKHPEVSDAVAAFSKSQSRKKFSKVKVNDFILKRYILKAIRESDARALCGLLSAFGDEPLIHERIREWNLFSDLLANNDQELLGVLISDLHYRPAYAEDVQTCGTTANFSFILSLMGTFLEPQHVMLEAIHAGKCEEVHDLLKELNQKELQTYIMECYKFRSLNALEVLVRFFPHAPVPLSIHQDGCPWIEGTRMLLNGIDDSNDFLHSIFCFANLEDVLSSRRGQCTGPGVHKISYFLQALSNIGGLTIPRTCAEFLFHPYDLRFLNSFYFKEFKTHFNKGWESLEKAQDYNGFEEWRRSFRIEPFI